MGKGPDKSSMAQDRANQMYAGLQGGPQINPQLEAAFRQQMQAGLDQQYNQAGQQLARTGLKSGAPQVHLAGLEANANVDADSRARLQAYDQANQRYQQKLQLYRILQGAASQEQQQNQQNASQHQSTLGGLGGAIGQGIGAWQGNRWLEALTGGGGGAGVQSGDWLASLRDLADRRGGGLGGPAITTGSGDPYAGGL